MPSILPRWSQRGNPIQGANAFPSAFARTGAEFVHADERYDTPLSYAI